MPDRSTLSSVSWLAVLLVAAACTEYERFDTQPFLQDRIAERVPPELRGYLEVPYALDDEIRTAVDERLSPAGSEKRRTDEILSFVFGWLDLEYALHPTRNAAETFRTRQANCLSFVNLFVGVGRHMRLNPFYVEVQDYQRWNYQAGVVISRGHIVAGQYIDGQLSTFDFLPYRPKSYRDFQPIDDLAAMAHYFNNLGAEALIAGDLETATRHLRLATALAPTFDKALNNLGVSFLRAGDPAAAREVFQRGLEDHPDNVPLLTNLVRAHQALGQEEQASALLERLEDVNQANPFFFVYRGEVALSEGDLGGALEYMRAALRTDSEVPEVHVGLVKVYLAMGDVEKARHHLQRALKLDATHDEARKFAALLEREAPSS